MKYRGWDNSRDKLEYYTITKGATEKPTIWMRATEVFDIHSKEVYEHDIVKVLRTDSFAPYIAVVYYSGGCFGTSWGYPPNRPYEFEPLYNWDVEILGNEYENWDDYEPISEERQYTLKRKVSE